jgi:hypothetical protein
VRTPDQVHGLPKNPTRDAERETRAKSGPVKHLVKSGQEVAALPDLDWPEQVDEIRRLNSKVLALVALDIDGGNIRAETIQRLKGIRCTKADWRWEAAGGQSVNRGKRDDLASAGDRMEGERAARG